MTVNEPSEQYRFYQDRLKDPSTPKWIIRGDPKYPGHYTVEGTMIVGVYNKSNHWRSQDELTMMSQINEAFFLNQDRRLKALIAEAKERFQEHAHDKVSRMWSDVFTAYEKGLAH